MDPDLIFILLIIIQRLCTFKSNKKSYPSNTNIDSFIKIMQRVLQLSSYIYLSIWIYFVLPCPIIQEIIPSFVCISFPVVVGSTDNIAQCILPVPKYWPGPLFPCHNLQTPYYLYWLHIHWSHSLVNYEWYHSFLPQFYTVFLVFGQYLIPLPYLLISQKLCIPHTSHN